MDERAVRFPVALDGDQLIWASDLAVAERRPEGLQCVGCGESVLLRAGAKNRPHFAHRVSSSCAAGETVLHRTTIRVLAEAILRAAAAGQPYEVFCGCGRCQAERIANLARPGCTVDVDVPFRDGIRPDLLVRQASGIPLAAIEVIVTHAPEPGTWDVYSAADLAVVCVWPTWDTLPEMRTGLAADLQRTEDRSTGRFKVRPCRFPRHHAAGPVPCPDCTAPARVLSAELATTNCYRCHKTFPVLDFIDCSSGEPVLIAASCPDLPNVKQLAGDLGIPMDVRHSRAARGSHLVHLCPHCRAVQGDNFLYAQGAATTDMTRPALVMTLCSSGHLRRGESRRWPAGSVARRPTRVEGLVGEPARSLRGAPGDRGGASVTVVDQRNLRAFTRHMVGLDGWT